MVSTEFGLENSDLTDSNPSSLFARFPLRGTARGENLKAKESMGGCVGKSVCEKQNDMQRGKSVEKRGKITTKSHLGAGLPEHSSQDGTVK